MKVPTPKKLPSGNWFVRLRLNGVSIPITSPSKKECIDKARAIKAQYKAGDLEIKTDEQEKKVKTDTLGAIIDAYIAKYEPVLSPSTIRGYNVVRKNRFKDYMSFPADGIDYQQMINDETTMCGPKTIKNAWGLVGAALKDVGLPVPTVKLSPAPVKEIPFLQPEEIKPFLKEMEGDLAEIPALFMLHGLRLSEVLGLTWENNIDLKKKKIKVRGSVVLNKDNSLVRKETNKNATSARTVDIMIPRLLALLEAAENKEGPVTTLFNTTIYHHVQDACKRAGVTLVGNHGLRHSFASLAYDLGWSERMIMDVGGWSNPATAHKIYIRIAKSRKVQNINSMAAFYGAIAEPKME